MTSKLRSGVGIAVTWALMLAGLVARGQEQVQLVPQMGTGGLWSVAFSHDGRLLVTGSEENVAQLWEMATERLLRSFVGHSRRVESVAFSPDAPFVLTGSADTTARLWNAATGESVLSFEGPAVQLTLSHILPTAGS
jgi:WD40 repeat protein